MFTKVLTESGAVYVLYTTGGKTVYLRLGGPRIVGSMAGISGTLDRFPHVAVGERMMLGKVTTTRVQSMETYGV
jgi:hypothetical protein